jgi:hypothetical protein
MDAARVLGYTIDKKTGMIMGAPMTKFNLKTEERYMEVVKELLRHEA